MEGLARLKVPGGKLIIVKLKYEKKIELLQILGDFFLYPEASLKKIEDSIVGMSIDATEAEISRRISEVSKSEGVEMIGITPESIAQTVVMAVKK
ncbi:MAG: biotin--protein ligase [Candidatus Micrarchaeota archaeon]|nr:biotin--protein ligase [Candidatus Micrarchaeota archaeon]MDE1848027.1 biotin--protein ligase [Candidatus Micrarchaeota archaeon]MDE1864596.1 biotin--protein ligase [Candidatus Micrarchaeota archaeon]